MSSLFDDAAAQRLASTAPLASLLRPDRLDDVVGQSHLIGPDGALRKMIASGRLTSMILWGPAGTGKTTMARLIASSAHYYLESLSAVSSGAKDVRDVLQRAHDRRGMSGTPTVLFIDEVHRFNKAQQDLLLPATESGLVVLIGATTENPFFEVNAALMSRTTLWRLHPLADADLSLLIDRAERLRACTITSEAREILIASADGDARSMLTTLDTAWAMVGSGPSVVVDADAVAQARDGRVMHQSRDTHYDQISAFIKSLRGSDPNAAVYWLLALLEAGESARFLARRLVILASEDIGLADHTALPVAEAAARAVEFVGLPEARLTLVHATLALALAPKSNSVTTALAAATAAVRAHGGEVPLHLRDSHYEGGRSLGFGQTYRYPHDEPSSWVDQQYLPEGLLDAVFYTSRENGEEKLLVERWRESTTRNGDSPVE